MINQDEFSFPRNYGNRPGDRIEVAVLGYLNILGNLEAQSFVRHRSKTRNHRRCNEILWGAMEYDLMRYAHTRLLKKFCGTSTRSRHGRDIDAHSGRVVTRALWKFVSGGRLLAIDQDSGDRAGANSAAINWIAAGVREGEPFSRNRIRLRQPRIHEPDGILANRRSSRCWTTSTGFHSVEGPLDCAWISISRMTAAEVAIRQRKGTANHPFTLGGAALSR